MTGKHKPISGLEAGAVPRLLGYMRVSTAEQNTALQEDALIRAGCAVLYEDRITGIAHSRDGLDAALADIRASDRLVVWRLDRLGRSIPHVMAIIAELENKGASLISIAENLDTGTESGELFATMLAMIAHVERRMIASRTRAGLQAAKDRGTALGRKPKLDRVQTEAARVLMREGRIKAEAVAARYGIGRATLFRNLKKYEARVGQI